jgi:hypothetical protein
MDTSKNNEKPERVYKANNVQRRRFEKLSEDLAARAKTVQRTVDRNERQVIYKEAIKEAAGDDYHALMKLRFEIIKLKRQVKALQESAAPTIERLKDKGIRGLNSYRDETGGFGYYLDPDTEEKKKDICSQDVGDITVQLQMFECPQNKLYAKYVEQCQPVEDRKQEMLRDHEELVAKIWTLTSAEEILEELDSFKNKWNCNHQD